MAAVQGRVSDDRVLVIEAIETEGVTAADTWGIGGQRRVPWRRGER